MQIEVGNPIDDPGIEAMRLAHRFLSPLPREQQLAALQWLDSRLAWEAQQPKPVATAAPTRDALDPAPCTACGGDGYYKGPRLGDEPCPRCKGHGAEPPPAEPKGPGA